MGSARIARLAVALVAAASACAGAGQREADEDRGATVEATTTTDAPPSTGPSAAPPTTQLVTGVVEGELSTPDGRTRSYRLYVPDRLPTSGVPLLVGLHGGTGWGAAFALQSGYDALADQHGFIVVYPDGIGIGAGGDQLRTWNGGYCCGPAANQRVDDVGFLDRLVDDLAARYPIDTGRVYAVGHSNGGILAYRLACERAERYTAIGVVAASLGVDGCRPSSATSFIHLHGTADTNHPLEGGSGPDRIAGVEFRSATWSVERLAEANRCTTDRSTIDPSNPAVTRRSFTGCSRGTEVQLATIEGANHRWMGGPQPDSYRQLSASRDIWVFVSQHSR